MCVNVRGFLILAGVLFCVWVAANTTLSAPVVVTGLVLSIALALVFARSGSVWREVRLSPVAIVSFCIYSVRFAVEIVRANVSVLFIVFSPQINIRPAVVPVATRLKSRFGRMSLANTLVLTPGTVVVDVEEDTLMVHCLDVEEPAKPEIGQAIAAPFEPALERIFG